MSKEAERAAVEADKQRLIREGELYRIKVVHAKALVGNALQPDALLHGAVEQAIGVAQARLGGLLQPGGLRNVNFKALLPYALTVGSYIARKRLVKPAMGVALAAGVGMAWLLRRQPAPQDEQE
ncbi:hypothetical protein D0T25_31510 [Duganella sp. BJB488]|uniref:hypothetical protein n=1 Tax=unclassified Duganella TaxID=2636909 RepID=UPI000E34AE10|nr:MULTISPECIES: hypothetical protein [unclassified Duganella]NVD70869.1 hypothetical protein [Duganella sp. BJB1802]RFP08732.1 hypothetical protein D0T26_31440 [Duganella sp. BJB489]RFP11513.1 hypothetical protein D0T25_31510 [Duganella sp. BJB488]RFP38044.1 hypothetical protein D0T24_00095 [Duganella sp. BJB480]